MLVFSVGLPAVGLLISIVSMQKQGINRKCGISTLFFFVALLIECFAWTLTSSGGMIEKVEIGIMFGTAGIHCLSAILAIMGLAEMRNRRKWSRGMKRGVWGFWLNIAMLFVLSLWFYAHVSIKFYNVIFK